MVEFKYKRKEFIMHKASGRVWFIKDKRHTAGIFSPKQYMLRAVDRNTNRGIVCDLLVGEYILDNDYIRVANPHFAKVLYGKI